VRFSWIRRVGLGRVDPDGTRERLGPGRFADEPFEMLLEGCGQHARALGECLGGEPRGDHVRGQQGDAAVIVFVVLPVEESLAIGAGVFQRAEPVRELGPVPQGLDLAFREWVVIGSIGPAVRLGDSEIGQLEGKRLAGHQRTVMGVEVGLAGRDALPLQTLLD